MKLNHWTIHLTLTQHCKSTVAQHNMQVLKSALHFVCFSTYASSLLTLFFVSCLLKNSHYTENWTKTHWTLSSIPEALLNYSNCIFSIFSIFLHILIIVIMMTVMKVLISFLPDMGPWDLFTVSGYLCWFCSCALATLGSFALHAGHDVLKTSL